MLIVISDLHFSDGTAGEHNLPYGAFEDVFLSDVASLAESKKVKKITLLLLGDIVDLIRSEKWFTLDIKDRPWGSDGLGDVQAPRKNGATELKCLEILGQVKDKDLSNDTPPASLGVDTILKKNWRTFKLFRDFKAHIKKWIKKDIPVEVVYIPGNHDRMCNLYPSLRDGLKKILGLTVNVDRTAEGDPWRFRYEFRDEEYGVFARHGHQYDIWNYADTDDLTYGGHLKVPVGDVLTTEFAVKIPWKLASLKKDYPLISDQLIDNVKEIDNIRPLSSVMEWIYYRIKKEDSGQIRKALDRTFKEIIEELLDIELIQKWRSPKTHLDEVLRAASSPWLSWVSKGLIDRLDTENLLPILIGRAEGPVPPEKDELAVAAYRERVWRENKAFQFILYGHTHNPLQLPLDGEDDHETVYINTGTWRNRIIKTVSLDSVPDFIGFKQMTYSIFYSKDEDKANKKPDTVSFDVWTGLKKKSYD